MALRYLLTPTSNALSAQRALLGACRVSSIRPTTGNTNNNNNNKINQSSETPDALRQQRRCLHRSVVAPGLLKGLDPALTADLLYTLRSMGHGDELVITDCNFPAAEVAGKTTSGDLSKLSK